MLLKGTLVIINCKTNWIVYAIMQTWRLRQERLGLARQIVIPNNSTNGLNVIFYVRTKRTISFVCYLASVIYELEFMCLDSYMCILRTDFFLIIRISKSRYIELFFTVPWSSIYRSYTVYGTLLHTNINFPFTFNVSRYVCLLYTYQ